MDEKFGMGAMGFGPLAGMTETMDFVKRAWSTFNLPSSMAPTIDLEEIDKRIADLRTVEQWLSLNLGMLQSAIQGLEIQRGTIAALKAFGDAVGAPGGMDAGANAAKAMAAMAASMGGAPMGGAPAGTAPTGAAKGAAPDPAGPAARHAEGAAAGRVEPKESAAGPFMHASTAAINPGAWWDLLQSQFSQVAQAAMAGAAAAAAQPSAKPAADPRAAKARKPAARRPAAGKAATRPRKPTG